MFMTRMVSKVYLVKEVCAVTILLERGLKKEGNVQKMNGGMAYADRVNVKVRVSFGVLQNL